MTDRNDRNERLRAVLRQGDPGRDDRGPSTAERAALRRLVVNTANRPLPPAWGRLPLLASALAVVALLAVVSLLRFGPQGNGAPPRLAGRDAIIQSLDGRTSIDPHTAGDSGTDDLPAVPGVGPAGTIDSDAPPSIRNVQFVTSGGTRIVWVLNRNLDI